MLARTGPASMAALLATLVLLFAFQGRAILEQPRVIALLAVPIALQVAFNAGLAYALNRRLGETRSESTRLNSSHSSVSRMPSSA